MQKERNVYVSILKLISTSFIVFIHAPFPGDFGRVMDCISRFAVPLMFMISGYYAYHVEVRTIKRRLRKIVLLAMFSNILYFLWNCYQKKMLLHESVRDYINSTLDLKTISHFLFTGDNLFSAHLWYLTTMILIYIVFIILTKFWERGSNVCYKPIYTVAICAFMFQIAFGIKAQSVGIEIHYLMYRYFLFFGFPFFGYGLFLHQYSDRIKDRYHINSLHVIMMIVFGIGLSLLQWFEIGTVEVPVGMLFVVTALALFAFVKPGPCFSRNRIFVGMETVSTVIYIIHPLIRNIINAHRNSVYLFHQIRSAEFLYPLSVMGFSLIIGIAVATVISAIHWSKSRIQAGNTNN